MARDDEFRKVAEDVRALARSLGRDFREAVDQATRAGRPTSEAFRHGLRGVADEARRTMRSNRPGPYYRPYYRGRGWRYPPPPEGGPAGPAQPAQGSATPEPSWSDSRPYWAGPRWPRRQPSQLKCAPLPPVRRRWDATTVIGMLAVLFGAAWLLGALHAISVPAEAVIASGLVLLGASLIVTARTDWSLSRHSWPVVLGAALIAVLIVTSTSLGVGGALDHISFGTMTRDNVGSGQTVYGGFGELTVHATSLAPGQSVKVQSVAGLTTIDTDRSVPLRVDAKLLGGQICVDGLDQADGVNANLHRVYDAPTAAPPVHVEVHQLFGRVLINGTGCGPR
ncbi:MAG: hypothetical protein JO337_11525 [Acidimicrobiales bacterium]|nr:hypothetical protein [Acidimicrobiales bacterium]